MEFYCTDSLVKIFPHQKRVRALKSATTLFGEEFHFQIFLRCEKRVKGVRVLSKNKGVCLDFEEYIPALNAYLPGADEYVVGETGLYPDLLSRYAGEEFCTRPNIATGFFVRVNSRTLGVGKHGLIFRLEQEGELWGETEISLTVLPFELSVTEKPLLVSKWLHCDCLADCYGYKAWSKKHFDCVYAYMKRGVENGVNCLLVPCFTPPLDTKVGGKRTDIQLVDIEEEDGRYSFDFSKLVTFLDLAKKAGVVYLEINHLFTQWGAEYCPNIYVMRSGKRALKFGWHTPANGEEYRSFLKEFLPRLDKIIQDCGYGENVYYHISDEPNEGHLALYQEHLHFLKETLPNCRVMDALSDFRFYGIGIDLPVVSMDHATPFLEKTEEIMVYYCTTQDKEYIPNSFFSTPSERNRVLGIMLYQSGVVGFLHWGFNFYNAYLSLRKINPFVDTDCSGRYQSGDGFMVYPDERGGVQDSLRLKVFFEGIQDYYALKGLEKKYGREFVLTILKDHGYRSYYEYPRSGKALLKLREKINRLLVKG